MDIRAASAEDYTFLLENDRHIRPGELRLSLEQGRVLLIRRGAERIGWLRWNLFWDNTPFMNLLYILAFGIYEVSARRGGRRRNEIRRQNVGKYSIAR